MPLALLVPLVEGAPARAPGPDLARYLLVCGGLIVVTTIVALAFKKFVSGKLRQRSARRSLSIVDVLPLGGKHKLTIVRCYDRTFVLGLGEREVSLVAELDTEAIASETEDGDPEFKDVLDTVDSELSRGVTLEVPRQRPRFEEVIG